MSLIDIKNDHRMFQFNAKVEEKKAEILIYDFIGKDVWFDLGVSDKDIADQLAKIDKDIELIEVRINSIGGSVFMGWAIYNLLVQSNKTIHVYIDGLAASIASVIALAGDKVFMAETSFFMIHKPMTSVFNANSNKMQETIDLLDMFEAKINNVYNKKSKLDMVTIKKMVSDETWMDADAALQHGFIDEIIPITDEMKVAACAISKDQFEAAKKFDNGWIKNEPNIVVDNTFVNAKLDDFINQIDNLEL